MTTLCARCGRRERAPGLLCCGACAEALVARKPDTRKARWVERAERSELPPYAVGGVAA